jgi:hypothetical protein
MGIPMLSSTARRVLLTFVLVSACVEAALQLGFLYWTLPAGSPKMFFSPGAFFIPDALIPVLRSALLMALVTYWWAADFVEKPRNKAPQGIARMLVAYIVLAQLLTRLFGALWSVYINGPVFYWLVAKGYPPMVVEAYTAPVNALVQVTMMVGFSFWAFKLAQAYRERGLPQLTADPSETAAATAPGRAPSGSPARKAAALFALSFLLLHVLGGEFALRMIGFLLIVGLHSGGSTLPVTAAPVAFLAYLAARRNLPTALTRVGAAGAGLAAFRSYLALHLAAILLFAIYGAALILADRGIDAILPMLLGMGVLYLLAIYPACRRFVRRGYSTQASV